MELFANPEKKSMDPLLHCWWLQRQTPCQEVLEQSDLEGAMLGLKGGPEMR